MSDVPELNLRPCWECGGSAEDQCDYSLGPGRYDDPRCGRWLCHEHSEVELDPLDHGADVRCSAHRSLHVATRDLLRRKQPSPSEAHIQRLRPVIPVHRLVLLVRSKAYGSEGLEPVDDRDCPYFQQHGYSNSCVSGSGGSLCGGFYGATADGYTRCTWLPRWTLRGQEFEVLPADDSDPRQQRATWN